MTLNSRLNQLAVTKKIKSGGTINIASRAVVDGNGNTAFDPDKTGGGILVLKDSVTGARQQITIADGELKVTELAALSV